MTEELLIERDMLPGDVDFILSSWLRSYRLSNIVRDIEKDVYYCEQNKIAKRLLLNSDMKMLVSAEDPDTIVAWMSSKDQWIHYIYVKHQFRRMKLASQLVGDPEKWNGYTHTTIQTQKMSLPPSWIYNPYKAWELSL